MLVPIELNGAHMAVMSVCLYRIKLQDVLLFCYSKPTRTKVVPALALPPEAAAATRLPAIYQNTKNNTRPDCCVLTNGTDINTRANKNCSTVLKHFQVSLSAPTF